MKKLDRVYHPFWLWEEVPANMWGAVHNRAEWVEKAREFTSDHERYGEFMMRVVEEWPYSCENALTDETLNRKAWVGHAACAFAIQCPEDVVRQAWGLLTDEQRFMANKAATRAIEHWERNYIESDAIRSSVEGSLL